MRILKLPRSLVPGTIVYRLKGSDPDPDVLTFGLKGPKVKELLEIRTVSFTEADVILKSHLKVCSNLIGASMLKCVDLMDVCSLCLFEFRTKSII